MNHFLPTLLLTSLFSLALQAEDKVLQSTGSQPVLYARLERPTGGTLSQGDVVKEASGSSRLMQPIPFRYAVASTIDGVKTPTANDLFIGKANHELFWRKSDRIPAGQKSMSFKKLMTGSVCDFSRTSLGVTEMNTSAFRPSRFDSSYEPPMCVMFFLRTEL